MIQKIFEQRDAAGKVTDWIFECPACCCAHGFKNDGRWTFNGDLYKPTFTPSLDVKWVITNSNVIKERCHSFVTDGMIHYQGDCTHIFAGQTLELLGID